jgi:xanthine dehydrogenase molybdenum-binding subunit
MTAGDRDATLDVVGRSIVKPDAWAKTTGRAVYLDDLRLPRMLTAKVLRSPYPHARVVRIDTAAAEAVPGVRAIIHRFNTPSVKFNSYWREPVDSDRLPDDEALFNDKARYVGDRVAAVAADSPEAAAKALELIDVDYEHLPCVTDPFDALKPDAPLIHEERGTNVLKRVEWHFGNVEEGFARSDLIVEDDFTTQIVQHASIETHGCIADFDRASGRLTVWSSTQGVHNVRVLLGKVLEMPLNRIRVLQPFVGGGFGGKNDLFEEPVAALLSLRAGRPVRLVFTREEEFLASRTRHANRFHLKVGVSRDGLLVARELRATVNAGGYSAPSPKIALTTGHRWIMLYRSPHVRYEGVAVYTNAPVGGAFRGFGTPQQTFATETLFDRIAIELGLDPVEFRRRNMVRRGDWDPTSKITIQSCELEACLDMGAAAIGWADKRGKRTRRGTKVRGVGCAIGTHNTGVKPFVNELGAAMFKLNEDGTASVLIGGCDIGQGLTTICAQIAAEVIGCAPEDVNVISGDSDACPYDIGTHSSRQAFITGNAVRLAADEARKQLVAVAADMLEAAADDVEIRDRKVFVRGTPARSLALRDVSMEAIHRNDNVQVMGRGSFAPDTNCPPFMAQFAEVEVDTDTGAVEIVQVVGAHDAGRAINPQIVEGQIEGGIAQGIGYALMEELVLEDGVPVNPHFVDYKLPCATDVGTITSIIVDGFEPAGPFGAKGVGEPALVATAPAIANAIRDATGVTLNELPMTAERVFRALRRTVSKEERL